MNGEQWRDVPSYVGLYQVSNQGRVKSFHTGAHNRLKPGRILKPTLGKRGYLDVSLVKDGIRKHEKVHILVALVFIGDRPIGYHINHKNGVKTDNRLSNLEYVTPQENLKHRDEVLGVTFKGTQVWNSRLDPDKVREIRRLRSEGFTYRAIANIYHIDVKVIANIIWGKSWKHVP